jgi:hypothetical protein
MALRAATVALICMGVSCGAIVGQVPFSQEGTGETTFQAKAGNVSFWTDFRALYHGDMRAYILVELVQDGVVVSSAICDPVHLGASHACTHRLWSWETHDQRCTMACDAYVPRAGPTQVRASLAIPGRPADLRLTRANLIVRQ